jgi:cold shock CspA family protein
MKDELPEYHGKIKMIDKSKGFGFIKSEIDNVDYYFKTPSLQEEIQLNDKVAFLLENKNERQFASAIRKIYQNKDGLVFIPRINSTHIHKGIEQYLSHIFDRIAKSEEEFIVKEFEFPEIIGKTTCVTTYQDDKIFYAIRKGRFGHTRFVENREPVDCNYMTIVLKNVATHYLIITTYIGRIAGKEPWDEHATLSDMEFWNKHALIFGEENIIVESRTDICPWVLNQHAICRLKSVSYDV